MIINIKTGSMKNLKCLLCILLYSAISWQAATAQEKNISGTVTDNAGQPVAGAAVIDIQNRASGTLTDADGHFSLTVSPETSLEISFMGYKTITVPVGAKDVVNAVLEDDTEYLEEVVVVGYGTVRKRDLTGAVSSVAAGISRTLL